MRRFLVSLVLLVGVCAAVSAAVFSYNFKSVPLPEALARISADHPELNLNFIYDELEHYRVSAAISTDDAREALKLAVGPNPVAVFSTGGAYYVEALQQGRFSYAGTVVSADGGEPVASAIVMLLAPRDSSMISYGMADRNGRFSIPCDRREVLAKISCMGYHTLCMSCTGFNIGTVALDPDPIVLNALKVNPDGAVEYPDKTVFIPQQRQKNASQSGYELLDRMGIPQLRINGMAESVATWSGRAVSMYVDGRPATTDDVRMLNARDVRRVEYYVYPSDPRFNGAPYVLNFVMAQYEYGGYTKATGVENAMAGSRWINLSSKMQYRRMTYDFTGYAMHHASSHYGEELDETYRLPEADGGVATVHRTSRTIDASRLQTSVYGALRATYASDRATAQTTVSGGLNRMPRNNRTGSVEYTPPLFESTLYSSEASSRTAFFIYDGYYFVDMKSGNSLTVSPYLNYTHTNQHSLYAENGAGAYANGARDNTVSGKLNASYTHDFGKGGRLGAMAHGEFSNSDTHYTGTVTATDKARTSHLQGSLSYGITLGRFYGYVLHGWAWRSLRLDGNRVCDVNPFFDFSARYAFSGSLSANAEFHYSTWNPSANYKSENVIQLNPLMRYTGNPNLLSTKSFDPSASVSWQVSPVCSLNGYAYAWIQTNRYVFVYTPLPDGSGILRTIRQPLGSYGTAHAGISASLQLLDRKLQLNGVVEYSMFRDGEPYDISRGNVGYFGSARYYAGDFDFGLFYESAMCYSDGFMNGEVVRSRSFYYAQAGWSHRNLNVQLTAMNFARTHWRNARNTMSSDWYSFSRTAIDVNSHALVRLSLTYTISYGKKVQPGNDISVGNSTSSGILK